jgi:hypothetical protein
MLEDDVLSIVGVSVLEEGSSPSPHPKILGRHVLKNSNAHPPDTRMNICSCENPEFYKCAFSPNCVPCSFLLSVCFILSFAEVLLEVVWEEVFKIFHVRIY